MSKHLDNLKRISLKLSNRYGDDDEIVRELQQEIDMRELKESKKVDRRQKKDQPHQRSGVVSNFESLRAN
jgi:hypothetical protein